MTVLRPELYDDKARDLLVGTPAEGSAGTRMRIALALAETVAVEQSRMLGALREVSLKWHGLNDRERDALVEDLIIAINRDELKRAGERFKLLVLGKPAIIDETLTAVCPICESPCTPELAQFARDNLYVKGGGA